MGIVLTSDFTMNSPLPLDDRTQVADVTARDAILAGRRWEGMIVYVIADATNYQLVGGITNGDWTELSGGGILTVADLTARDAIDAGDRYEGLIVYVESEETNFQLVGGILDANWTELSGAGGGGINFIENGDGERNADGWTVYANVTPAATPEVLPSGTPSGGVTWTQSSSGPLIGDGSFIFAKDASNRQGEGVLYDFTIPFGYLGSVVTIKMRYLVLVGSTFTAGTRTTDSDLTVYILDDAGSRIIQPSNHKFFANSNNVVDEFQAEFQVPVTDVNYRLYIHVATTNASAYSVKFDAISISPNQYVFGSPIVDSVTVPLTWASVSAPVPTKGTIVRDYYRYSKLGDKIVLELDYEQSSAGTGGTGVTLVPLPPGIVMDSTQPTSTTSDVIVGSGKFSTAADGASVSSLPLVVVPYNSTHLALFVQSISGTALQNSYSAISSSSNSLANTNFNVSFKAEFKVAGWSSSVQMADQTSTRVVSFRGTASGQTPQTLNSTTAFSLTANEDTHAAWSTNTYTVPVSGYYFINWLADAGLVTTGSINNLMQAYIIKNGVAAITGLTRSQVSASLNSFQITASGTLLLNAGDTISVNLNTNFTTPGTTASGTLSILRISGPSQIAASETVAASAWLNASAASSNASNIIYNSKEYDTHNAYSTSTGEFTCPISGLFYVAGIGINSTNAQAYCVYKNGTLYKTLGRNPSASVSGAFTGTVPCVAGDRLSIRNNGGSVTHGGNATLNEAESRVEFRYVGVRG